MKKERQPARIDHSTHVGLYTWVPRASRCLVKVGTMMVKRSSHMPIWMEIEARNIPLMVFVFLKLRMGRGMTKQNRIMAQNSGANLPVNLDQNTSICVG